MSNQPQTVYEVEDLLAQAIASLDAAATSASRRDVEAAIDDLLAARLLLTTLIHSLTAGAQGERPPMDA